MKPIKASVSALSLHRRSERGFVLIAALMAVMVLMAVGFFILTTTSQDVKISSRLVGERKALSSAESGLQQLCINFTPASPATGWINVDTANDPTAQYQVNALPSKPSGEVDAPGWDADWSYKTYEAVITGRDTSYQSEVQLSVGVKHGPTMGRWEYE
jgi:Tfp pilus assembly protein PilX